MRKLGVALTMILSSCGSAGAKDGGDRFLAGTWQLEGWMESNGRSARGDPGASLSDSVILSEAEATMPPADVFFSRFYHGATGEVRFRDGKVEGMLQQARVDDIAEHEVPVAGTYAPDRFRVTFGYTAFGMTINQVVEGRLVKPAR